MVGLINAYLRHWIRPAGTRQAVELDRAVPEQSSQSRMQSHGRKSRAVNTDAAITLKEVNRLAGDDPEHLIYTGRL